MQKTVFSIGRLIDGVYYASGTCTLLNKINTLVTAAHVVNGNDENLFIKINDNFIDGYQDTTVQGSGFIPVKITEIDPFRDICILQFKNDAHAKSKLILGDTDQLNTGEIVTVFGFPHSNLGRIVLTQQTCGVGAKILLSSNSIKSKHLVLNIQARPGQSGGPIFSNINGSSKLIGILIGAYVPSIAGTISIGGIDPQTLHQTTHAVSAEYIERML